MDLRRARLISLDLTDTQSSDHFNCQVSPCQLTSVPKGTEFVLSRQPTSRVLASRFSGQHVSLEGTSRASLLHLCALRQALEPQRVQCVSSEGTSRASRASLLCARLSYLSGYSVYLQKVHHASHAPHCSVPDSRASVGTLVSSEGTSRVSRASLLCARLPRLSEYSVYPPRVSPA